MALRSFRRKKLEGLQMDYLWSVEIFARKAKTMEELNESIERILAMATPASDTVRNEQNEICAYVRGRKDGRPYG